MAIDPPENVPLDELGALKPTLQGAKRAGRLVEPEGNGNLDHGAFLIALRAAQPHNQPVGLEAQIVKLERGEFRATKGASEPDQQQGPVTSGRMPYQAE